MSIHLKINLMTWNVSGLNESPKRIAVRQTVLLERPDILGFQETKISQIDTATLREICRRHLNQFVMLPSQGTRGGILVTWNQSRYTLLHSEAQRWTLLVRLQDNRDSSTLLFTSVYGPTNQRDRWSFFENLSTRPTDGTPWVIGGDFT